MKMTLTSLWQDCLSQLQDQVSPTDFSTWLRPLQADIPSENQMVLYASNVFVKNWVETHYLELITKLSQSLSGNIDFSVRVQEGTKPAKPVEKKPLCHHIRQCKRKAPQRRKPNSPIAPI